MGQRHEDHLESKVQEYLTNELSGSELTSFLLQVFKSRTNRITPSELVKHYAANRFVHPAELDALSLKRLELELLQFAVDRRVRPMQLSPVTALGCASVVGTVDQHKVVSALRGVEVVSDATNAMALHIAKLKKTASVAKGETVRLCTTHRHLRAQYFGEKPGLLPHFHLFCMVTAGEDEGSYRFEKAAFREHIEFYRDFFENALGAPIEVVVSLRSGYKDAEGFLERMLQEGDAAGFNINVKEPNLENRYYQGLQFTLKTFLHGQECVVGDGGFVDWTQKLVGKKKERLLISAIGLDRLLT